MMTPVTRAAAIEIPDPTEIALREAQSEWARLRQENNILQQKLERAMRQDKHA